MGVADFLEGQMEKTGLNLENADFSGRFFYLGPYILEHPHLHLFRTNSPPPNPEKYQES